MNKKFKTVSALLRDPKRWTQGGYAKTTFGVIVSPCSKLASQWCLVGAVYKIYGYTIGENKCAEIDAELSKKKPTNCIRWNDSLRRKHAEVLALCRKLKL